MADRKRAAFGLGSNMGNSRALLQQASEALCALPYAQEVTLRASSIYTTPALLPENAPAWWNRPFLNQVITLMLDMEQCSPHGLLAAVKDIEQRLGRVMRGHWAPREIDIDIVLIGELRVHDETLTIPHAAMMERDFVLEPLREIWPDAPGLPLADTQKKSL